MIVMINAEIITNLKNLNDLRSKLSEMQDLKEPDT
jgi:hypothetical protein